MSTVGVVISQRQRETLLCVPASTRPAFSRVDAVVQTAYGQYGASVRTILKHIHELGDLGLIQLQAGSCRRTPDGDEAAATGRSE